MSATISQPRLRRRRVLRSGLAVLLTSHALAQAAVIDAVERKAAVDQAAALLRGRYVGVETGERAAAIIQAELAAGDYDALNDRDAFAARLTSDIYAATRDKHLVVRAPSQPSPNAGPGARPPADGGVVRVDRLAGGIGYIELIGFPARPVFQPAIERAMALVAQAPALIIDVRRNSGGAAPSVMYFASFFVDGAQRIKLMTYRQRVAGTKEVRVQETFSEPTPTAFVGKPVYVLTGPYTFSGGEGFAYQLQGRGLARTVGETTGGGANPGGGQQISEHLGMFISTSSTVHPITGTNWEGVGVLPDIAVPASEALKAALRQLGQKTEAASIDVLSQASLFKAGANPLVAPQPRGQ